LFISLTPQPLSQRERGRMPKILRMFPLSFSRRDSFGAGEGIRGEVLHHLQIPAPFPFKPFCIEFKCN